MQDYTGPCRIIQHYTRLHKTMQNYTRLNRTMQNHIELYRTWQNHTELKSTERFRRKVTEAKFLIYYYFLKVQWCSFYQHLVRKNSLGKLLVNLRPNQQKISVNNNNNLIQSNKKLIMQQITDLTSGSLGSINID